MTLAFFVFAGATQTFGATTFTVNQTGDAGDGACDASCTLRDAIGNANGIPGADEIVFSPLFNTAQTINLTSATLTISQSVTITGRGARLLTVRRAINNPINFRIFDISGAAAVSISGMTISNGNVPDGSGSGGIRNTSGGTLTLDGVAVSGNTTTAEGGGIGSAFGTTTILNSTVSGNTAGLFCGGIRVSNGSTVNIANSTVSGNSAPGASGGIVVFSTLNMNNVTVTNNRTTNGNAGNAGGVFSSSGAVVNTRNTIIAGNFALGGGRPDVGGAFNSNGNNLIGSMTTFNTVFTQPGDKTDTPANLDVLANNGGQTDTHRPLPGSEAIDAGNNCVVNQSCGANNPPVPLQTDQRGTGFFRQVGAAVDIGAFEVQFATTAASVSVSGRVVTESGRGVRNVVITMTDMLGNVRIATTTGFGYYRFENVAAGETYIFAARGKRFFFAQSAQVHSIIEETNDVNFVAGERERTVFPAN